MTPDKKSDGSVGSELSVLADSPFPNAKNRASEAALMRELRKRAQKKGVNVAADLPLVTTSMLFPGNSSAEAGPPPKQTATPIDHVQTLNQRVDAISAAFKQHRISLSEYIATTCAFDYAAQRAKEEPGFRLSRNDAEEAERVRAWARTIALQTVLDEAKVLESQRLLHTGKKSRLTIDWLKNWNPNYVYQHLQSHMPYFLLLLTGLIQGGKNSTRSQEKTPLAISVTSSLLWTLRSQQANYFARGFTTYLYASGVRSSTINVLNRIGLSMSYGSLLENLDELNKSCTENFRAVATRCCSFFMWDNVNFDSSTQEQRIKHAGSFESGTAATIVEFEPPAGLSSEDIEDALNLEAYLSMHSSAPDLTIADLWLSPDDHKSLRDEFAFQAMSSLINYGGVRFQRYKKLHKREADSTGGFLPPQVTKAHPLPTFHLEQASANGNATVMEEIRLVTQIDKSPWFKSRLTVATGDLLTVDRILSVRDVRTLSMRTPVHVKDPHENLTYLVTFAGLFHTRMAAATAVFQTHFGTANIRPKDSPASLWRHNEILKRKNLASNQKIDYRTAQDLIFHSLYPRLIDIIRIQSHSSSVDALGEELEAIPIDDAWARLQSLVHAAVTKYTTPRTAGTDDAIKLGNMPMVVLVLKVWAISFRAAGRKQYAAELLRFRHNLLHAWPKPLRDLILANMLVNTTGRTDGWKETDLLQEHLNYWIKIIYKAHGSNALWDWLGRISTCIPTLCELARSVNSSFAPPNSNRHSSPDLQVDVDTILKSLIEEEVHILDRGRRFPSTTLRATDTLAAGLHQLEGRFLSSNLSTQANSLKQATGASSPLRKFNENRFGARSPAPPAPPNARTSHPETHTNESNLGSATTGADNTLDTQANPGTVHEPLDSDEFEVVMGEEEDAAPFGLDM